MLNELCLLLEKIIYKFRVICFGDRNNQLELVLPFGKQKKNSLVIPEGFYLRNYKVEDKAGLLSLMELSGFSGWDGKTLEKLAHYNVPNGFFVLIERGTEKVVSTMVARHHANALHPEGGDVGWLCTHPDYKGRGFGLIVAAAATKRLVDIGYSNIYVNTDDRRLPAIKIFLKMGFEPLMYTEKMISRWTAIFEKLDGKNSSH